MVGNPKRIYMKCLTEPSKVLYRIIIQCIWIFYYIIFNWETRILHCNTYFSICFTRKTSLN